MDNLCLARAFQTSPVPDLTAMIVAHDRYRAMQHVASRQANWLILNAACRFVYPEQPPQTVCQFGGLLWIRLVSSIAAPV